MLRLLLLFALSISVTARAELVIEITEGIDDPIPVAFVPFQWQGSGALPLELADLIENNMERTGLFEGTLGATCCLALPPVPTWFFEIGV